MVKVSASCIPDQLNVSPPLLRTIYQRNREFLERERDVDLIVACGDAGIKNESMCECVCLSVCVWGCGCVFVCVGRVWVTVGMNVLPHCVYVCVSTCVCIYERVLGSALLQTVCVCVSWNQNVRVCVA